MDAIFGLYGGDIRPQPDLRLTRNENGGVTASQSYYVRTDSIDASTFAKGRGIKEVDPDVDPAYYFLSVVSFDIVDEEGGVSLVRVNYSGSAFASYGEEGLGELAEPTYRLDFTLVDKPISEHPKFLALDLQERISLGAVMSGEFIVVKDGESVKLALAKLDDGDIVDVPEDQQIESADAKEFALRIAMGRDTYEAPTFTWTETVQGTDGLSASQLNKVGKITTPRGDPPTPNDRNWRLMGGSQEERGKLKMATLEWALSEDGGHDEFLYGD